MTFDQMTLAAFRKAPPSLRGRVTFLHKDGRDTTAEAMGVTAKGAGSDGFAAGIEIQEKHRRLVVMPQGLDFAPRPGMIAEWGRDEQGAPQKWNVLNAVPAKPNGTDVLFYRVTLKR